jgi:multidrug resistance efflux pump
MPRVWLVSLLALLLLGLSACAEQGGATPTAVSPSAPTTTDVNSVSVNIGTDIISAEGRIIPLDDTALPFLVPGQVGDILVSEGDVVVVGQPLIQLDITDQLLILAQAEAALSQTSANVTTAEANIVAAEAGLKVAEAGLVVAEARLALLESGATEAQIALSESQLAAANAGVQQAAGARDVALEGANAAQIQAAQAQVAAAQAGLVPLQLRLDQVNRDENASAEQKQQAQLQYNAGVAQVQAAQAALAELQAGPTTAVQQTAQGGVGAAIAQRDAAQAQLDLTLAGSRAEQIAIVQTEVTRAQNNIAEAEIRIQQAQAGLVQAQAAVDEVTLSVAQAQAALERTQLTAPIAGTVADIAVRVGEVVQPGVPVLTLADMNGWLVETTDLTELNVVTLKVGLPVEITVDAFPGEQLSGRVRDIAKESELVLGDVTYRVEIEVEDDLALPLRWGMTSFVNISTEQ